MTKGFQTTAPQDRKYFVVEKLVEVSSNEEEAKQLLVNGMIPSELAKKHEKSGKGWTPVKGRGHAIFEFYDAIPLSGIEIVETFHGGSIKQILGTISTKNSDWVLLYVNPDPKIISEFRVFSPILMNTLKLKQVKIEFDTLNEDIEIYSIRIYVDPSEKWLPYKMHPLCISSPKFVDMTILLEDGEVPCHKIAIANKWYDLSLTSSTKLYNQLKTENKISLPGIHLQAFNPFLEFIYFGSFKFFDENIFENYAIAETLGLEEIQKDCIQKINASFETIVNFYKKRDSFKFSIKDIDYACEEFIINNFKDLASLSDFQYVPRDILERLLDSSMLYIPEIELFEALVTWGKAHPDDVKIIAKKIRYGLLTRKELDQVVKPSKLCPEDIFKLVCETEIKDETKTLWKPRKVIQEDDFLSGLSDFIY